MPQVLSRTTPRIRGRRWMAIRRFIINRDPLCDDCLKVGRVSASEEVDHVIPLSHGGSNDPENLKGKCKECHLRKTTGKARVHIGSDGWPC